MQLFSLLQLSLGFLLPCPFRVFGAVMEKMVIVGKDIDLLLDRNAGEGLVEGAEG